MWDIVDWGGAFPIDPIFDRCACPCASCHCPCISGNYSSGYNTKQQDNGKGNKAGGQVGCY